MVFKSVANRGEMNGFEKLIEAILLNYINCIKSKRHYRIAVGKKSWEVWLENQKKWVIQDDYFISAYADIFGYDEFKIKQGLLVLIDKTYKSGAKKELRG